MSRPREAGRRAHIAFHSPREALGYMYARSSGPGMASPRWHDAPTGSRYCEAAAHIMRAIVYGLLEVRPDSRIDLELRAWATDSSIPRSPKVFAVYKRVLRIMREHDLLARYRVRGMRSQRVDLDRVVSELETGDGDRLRFIWRRCAVEPADGGEGPSELRTVAVVDARDTQG